MSKVDNFYAPFDAAQDRMIDLLNKIDGTFLRRLASDPHETGELSTAMIYESLAKIIPPHFTIIDLGCAEGAQAVFFMDHYKYVGIDLLGETFPIIPNATFYGRMSSDEFILNHLSSYNDRPLFAICSYVPPWGGVDSGKLTRETFKNLFVFYPEKECGE